MIPEQLFSTDADPVEGISAVKALAIASAQGQRIYTIDQTNLSTAIAALTFDDDAVKQEIQTQVGAGFVVTVHRDELSYAGWSGVGYTVIDPGTGAGAYKISGGSDGAKVSNLSTVPDPVLYIVSVLGLLQNALGVAATVVGSFLAAYNYFISCIGHFSSLDSLSQLSIVLNMAMFAMASAGAGLVLVWFPVLLALILAGITAFYYSYLDSRCRP